MKVHSIATFAMLKRLLPLPGLLVFAAACDDAAQITQPEAAGSALFNASVASASGGTFAYVTNSASDEVSVIDLATNTVVASIPVRKPTGIAITPDGTRAYVAEIESNTVAVIDLATNTVVGSPIPVAGRATGIAITPDGTRAYGLMAK